MRDFARLWLSGPLTNALVCAVVLADPLYLDTFEDGNYASADGPNGLMWTVNAGTASVDTVLGSLRLGLPGGTNCVVAHPSIALDDFTLAFDARLNWSNPARVLFLYVDPDNFYALGLASGNKGVYRRMNGVETKLYDDASSLLRLPHDREALNSFKIHVCNTGAKIEMQLDRAGDGRDYDVALTDTNAIAVLRFLGTRTGASNAGGANTSSLFHLDNVAIHEGFLEHARVSLTYYIDDGGEDARSSEEAQSPATPWRTVQRAASVAQSGDTIAVMPGIYRETVVPVYSGSSGRPIIYRAADSSDRPVMDGSDFVGADGWEQVTLTNHLGTAVALYRHSLGWSPPSVFQGDVRLFAAQEPNQSDPDDPYDTAFFRPVPSASNAGTSTTRLVDEVFLIHTVEDYWKGATLLLYDSASNTILERQITAFDPLAHALTTAAFTATIGSGDKYAIRHHPGILDQPGEYHVDAGATPAMLYVWPLAGHSPTNVTAARFASAFNLSRGDYSGTVLDGFEMRRFTGNAVDIQARCSSITVRNCHIHRTMSNGVHAEYSDGILVSNCLVEANHNDGVNFGAGSHYAVVGCEITRNGNNGVWAGTGGDSAIFNTDGVLIRGNHLHHQGGRRSHADNYQMHQCDNVLIEDNLLVQNGEQNGWCQYTGHLTMRNNTLLNGNFGVNSTMFSEIHHNAFVSLSLRYDAHLTDAPVVGDYYKPRQAAVRNNLFVNASLGWPAADVVDRFAVFTVDHNYYNSENLYTLEGWDWQGYRCGIHRGGSHIASGQRVDANGMRLDCKVWLTWSEPARLLALYKDPTNHYAIGLASSNRGIYRTLQGQETRLFDDAANLLRLAHASPAIGLFSVCATNDGTAVRLLVGRDNAPGSYDAVVVDADPAAVAMFAGDVGVGLLTTSATTGTPWCFMDDVSLRNAVEYRDDFEDGNCTAAAGSNGMAWIVGPGAAAVSSISGRGVGFGAGSIVRTNLNHLASVIAQPPDATFTTFDFHLLPNSALRDAGVDVGVVADAEGTARPLGSAVDIGAYEYEPMLGTLICVQ